MPEEKLQRSVQSVFEKTGVSHHSLQKTLLTGSVASPDPEHRCVLSASPVS